MPVHIQFRLTVALGDYFIVAKVTRELFHEKVCSMFLQELSKAKLRLFFFTDVLWAVDFIEMYRRVFLSRRTTVVEMAARWNLWSPSFVR